MISEAASAALAGLAIPDTDPERPLAGHYSDLTYVPWYAAAPFAARLQYLNAMIALRAVEDAAWRLQERAKEEASGQTFFLSNFVVSEPSRRLRELIHQREVELADREPLPDYLSQNYEMFLDSQRWKRTRRRKLVSVKCRCEELGCARQATECHHLHYETLGFEENYDLEALCSDHHRARHGRR
jgi:hypothetical protein